jgi:hypothetical protein
MLEKRKILALALVLAMASFADAALTMTIDYTTRNINEVAVITISSNVAEEITWGVYLDPTSEYPTNARLQNATILSAAGNQGSVTSGGSPTSGNDYESLQGGPGLPDVGDWSTVEFVGLTVGTYTIDLYQPAGGGQVATADITVVPEPATIALLGLGGLFLLRRRR